MTDPELEKSANAVARNLVTLSKRFDGPLDDKENSSIRAITKNSQDLSPGVQLTFVQSMVSARDAINNWVRFAVVYSDSIT
jgi:hypothetical protein